MRFFNTKKHSYFWLMSLILFFIIKISTSLIIAIFFTSKLKNVVLDNISNLYFEFVLAILIAPIIETFVFFKLVLIGLDCFKQIKFINKYKLYLFMLISSLLFSMNHCYSFAYLLNGFISGLLYSFIYYKSYIKRNYPFIGTVIVHSLYNLFVFYSKL